MEVKDQLSEIRSSMLWRQQAEIRIQDVPNNYPISIDMENKKETI